MGQARAALLPLLLAACASAAPRSAQALYREAVHRYSRGDEPEALALAEQALLRNPDYLDAHLFRAGVLATAGRAEEARAAYSEILRRDPKHREALAARAVLGSELGLHADALADAERYVAEEPRSCDARLLRGYVHARAGRIAEAHRDYAEARARDADRWQAYHAAGVRDFQLRRLATAERNFELAAALAPERPEPLVGLGRVHAEARRFDRAAVAYTRALDFAPDDPQTLYLRGLVWLALRKAREAIDDLTRSIASDPRPGAHVARGLARRIADEVDGAEADFTEAIRIDPNHREAYRARAQLRHELGVLGDAERDYLAALGISTTVADLRGLARLYVDKEDFDRARRFYEQALKLPMEPALREQITRELADLRKRRGNP